jgi:hypothetical protein
LVLLGFESLAAAEASVPLNAEDCFSRYDDMVAKRETSSGSCKAENETRTKSKKMDLTSL